MAKLLLILSVVPKMSRIAPSGNVAKAMIGLKFHIPGKVLLNIQKKFLGFG